ncbi:hypothetical protein K438DRAFT_1811306 [Mycena galopus ATCC 62051]|nr:hypothetical protein K438DRAFT_1811306 [Mycena galopus ATCC 62051]
MFFLRIHFFGFFLLFLFSQCQQVFALAFAPIVGPYVKGAQVPVQWTLNGSEPTNGWELWFNAGGSSMNLQSIAPLATSTVAPFPGSNGAFQALSGLVVLATSNKVDLVTAGLTATATFSASVTSGSGSGSSDGPAVTSSAAAESATSATSSALTTEALLGIVVGTLAVIAVTVLASVSLFVYRRRRVAATSNKFPFEAHDVEKQLAEIITPFGTPPLPPPPRGSSLPRQPLPAVSSSSDLRRQAYLNAQLQRLEVAQPNLRDPESGSIVFGPLSSVPSEGLPRPDQDSAVSPTSAPLPPIPDSRRAAYLAEQLYRLALPAERRPSDGSVVFGPLSSVPSEGTARPYAPSVSTDLNSPIQFFRHAQSPITSPVSPPIIRLAPWSISDSKRAG